MADVPVCAVLKDQLKTLCLNSFPCGTGNWNTSQLRSGKLVPVDSYWESDDPEEETLDSLNALLTCSLSPWALEDSFSPEAQCLKQLAIKDPGIITDQFIHSYFKSLRVVDKEVSEVDGYLLAFKNLEELVLSVNKIRTIISSNLPRTLKVLELCSNQISSLKDLSLKPPQMLQHLGLSYNRIQCSDESTYLTADYWPNLVSLDLSFNNLTDLFVLVPRVTTLPLLRILLLQGNPLALVPVYRGYIVDSLPALLVLDDIPILPDEKHQFSGLINKKETLDNAAQLVVSIGKLQGIPDTTNPIEQNPGEYPVTTYSYYVTYGFVEDHTSGELPDAQGCVSKQLLQTLSEESGEPLGTSSSLGSFKTVGKPWLDVIDYEYKRKHTVRDLRALKDFLLCGMTVTVTEEKTLHWPQDQEQNVESKSDKKGGGKKEKEKEKKDKSKDSSSSKGSKADSKSKKAKENVNDLRHDPPILQTLGSTCVSLESLISGKMQISTVCNFGVSCTSTEKQPSAPEKDTKKKKDMKVKSGRETADTRKTPASASAKGKRKESAEAKPTEDQLPPPPVPLTVDIQIQLVQWKSTLEAQEQQEKFPMPVKQQC
ncbi:leucine-rich repeat-containing protein 43 [Discoglossus pictus]